MNIAFVGTGFVADYYMTSLANYPQLVLLGAYDHNANRLNEFCSFYKLKPFSSLDEILNDPGIDIVVNLTTPENHFHISSAALNAGKHVYSEKPLAMDVNDAAKLVALAQEKKLILAAAPANALSAAHKLVKQNLPEIGQPRLVYAEMEDGPVFRDKWASWKSKSGAPWPGLHEFEIGCTLEHAGYALSWLVSLFGPVKTVNAFAAISFPDKGDGTKHIQMAPDFTVGCLQFHSGTIARVTCGLAMPRDRSLTIVGDQGSITVDDLWDERSHIRLEKLGEKRSFMQRLLNQIEPRLGKFINFRPAPGKRLSYPKQTKDIKLPAFPSQIDFARGIADMERAISIGTKPFFSADVALHITEVALALNNADKNNQPYQVQSRF
ncbi:Gfo/Idh/MocA family oxidoreductase [Paenochrobactrum glaciei]|uniref:Gfo/Idh/MocA family oxidoreductase n=1 Tax=Paenochrobactrum glaciei TaxID=486407 RepID=A0ABN1FKR4_9HYPH